MEKYRYTHPETLTKESAKLNHTEAGRVKNEGIKIDGWKIAHEIYDNLQPRIELLKEDNIYPHLAVVNIGFDAASDSYTTQEEKCAKKYGIGVTTITDTAGLLQKIRALALDPKIHGIMIQLPLPEHISLDILKEITPEKDIDCLNPEAPFHAPLGTAVIRILKEIHLESCFQSSFDDWIFSQNIAVIGQGRTGGAPVINELKKFGGNPKIVDINTPEAEAKMIKYQAGIIVTTVGLPNIITADDIHEGAILVCVGMYEGKDGKMYGDYDAEKIKYKTSAYTPILGGVGPVNVATLLENVIIAAERR